MKIIPTGPHVRDAGGHAHNVRAHQQLAIKALQKPPTVAAVGADLSGMPSHDEIAGWFRGMVN